MQRIKYVKQPVAVIVAVGRDRQVRPRKFQWKDGRVYTIDRVSKKERAASTKADGCGVRYTVMVEGVPRFLYDEGGKWYMEDEVLVEADE